MNVDHSYYFGITEGVNLITNNPQEWSFIFSIETVLIIFFFE